MDAKQEKEFESFGCASRCLIALANSTRARLTKETYIDRFTQKYWSSGNMCGGLTLTQIKEVGISLGLASSIKEAADFSDVRFHISSGLVRFILVYTQKKHEPDGTLSDYHHCTIVSPTVLQGQDLLYLDIVDFVSGRFLGQFQSESYILSLAPTFLLFVP